MYKRQYLECSPEQQVVEMLPESGSVPVEVSVALCLLPDRDVYKRQFPILCLFGAGMDGIGPDRQRIGNSGEVIGE